MSAAASTTHTRRSIGSAAVHLGRLLLLVVAAALLAAALPVAAGAQTTPGTPTADPQGGVAATTTARSLPEGFPADLRYLVAGTDEFRAAPWFSGPCADRGGDVGGYITEVLAAEDRMTYWTSPTEAKLAMWNSAGPFTNGSDFAGRFRDAGATVGADGKIVADDATARALATLGDPPDAVAPKVFPAGDETYFPKRPTCADSLAEWNGSSTSTWGFDWASSPDEASLATMRTQPGADAVPDKAWTGGACDEDVPSALCTHAFFADCADIADLTSLTECGEWNGRIGRLFGGTMNWIDQNTSYADRLGDTLRSAVKATPQYKFGSAVVSAYSWYWDNVVSEALAFVADPTGTIDEWANTFKSGAAETSTEVLRGLGGIGIVDLTSPEFLRVYAAAAGLGLLVLALMVIFASWRLARQEGPPDWNAVLADTFVYMPTGMALMLYTPGLVQMFVTLTHTITEGVLDLMGTDVDQVIANLSALVNPLTEDTLVGGILMAIVGYGLLALGALMLVFGMLMQSIAVPLLTVVVAIGYGMWVHPKWREKALRPVMVGIGVIVSKPLLMILVATTMAVMAVTGADAVTPDGKNITSLIALLGFGVGFIVIGLAPFALLRWAPITPTASDSADFGREGSGTAQAIGSMPAYFANRAGGGGGGGGGSRGGGGKDGGSASADQATAATGNPQSPGGGGAPHTPAPGGGQHHQPAGHTAGGPGGHTAPRPHGGGSGGGGRASTALLSAVPGVGTVAAVGVAGTTMAGQAMQRAAQGAQNAPEDADRS